MSWWSSAALFILASVRSPDTVRELISDQLQHSDVAHRTSAILRFSVLWRFRHQVWPRLELGAHIHFKVLLSWSCSLVVSSIANISVTVIISLCTSASVFTVTINWFSCHLLYVANLKPNSYLGRVKLLSKKVRFSDLLQQNVTWRILSEALYEADKALKKFATAPREQTVNRKCMFYFVILHNMSINASIFVYVCFVDCCIAASLQNVN